MGLLFPLEPLPEFPVITLGYVGCAIAAHRITMADLSRKDQDSDDRPVAKADGVRGVDRLQ
jgi:hypothetical protein